MNERPQEVLIFERMIRLAQNVQRQAEAVLEGQDIRPAQFFILSTLASTGPIPQTELARRMRTTAANVSQLLSRMEQASLITRARRGVSKFVSLTAVGTRLLEELRPQHDAFFQERFSALTSQEATTLLTLLERLLQAQDPEDAP